LVRSDIKRAKRYVDDTYVLAQSNPDPIFKAYSYLTRGVYLIATDKYDSAIQIIKSGEEIATRSNNKNFLLRSGVALGRTYMYSGNPEQALTHLYNTMKLLETNPNPEIEMKVRVNITWAYLELKRYREAVNFGNKSLTLIKPGLEYMIPYLCNNTAASYGALGILDSV